MQSRSAETTQFLQSLPYRSASDESQTNRNQQTATSHPHFCTPVNPARLTTHKTIYTRLYRERAVHGKNAYANEVSGLRENLKPWLPNLE